MWRQYTAPPTRFVVHRRLYLNQFRFSFCAFFFFNDPATTEIYTLSLHDALPISRLTARGRRVREAADPRARAPSAASERSEEHTSELQSRENLVCRLLLEKKKKKKKKKPLQTKSMQ